MKYMVYEVGIRQQVNSVRFENAHQRKVELVIGEIKLSLKSLNSCVTDVSCSNTEVKLRRPNRPKYKSPRSMNDNRYIRAKIGMSLKSTFRHSLFSSSSVKVGGGGREVSPPKSTPSEPTTPFSIFASRSFSKDIVAEAQRARFDSELDARKRIYTLVGGN